MRRARPPIIVTAARPVVTGLPYAGNAGAARGRGRRRDSLGGAGLHAAGAARRTAGGGVAQLAAATGLRPATAHCLLRALCAAGVVTQDPVTRLYQPTLRLLEWGQAAVLRLEVREVANPFL